MSKSSGDTKLDTGAPSQVPERKQQLPPQPPVPPGVDQKLLLQMALKMTYETGLFYDTKFYVFTRRNLDGVLYEPKPVYANGWVLRAALPTYFEQRESQYFEQLRRSFISLNCRGHFASPFRSIWRLHRRRSGWTISEGPRDDNYRL